MTAARIPFSAEDSQEIAQLGTWMMVVAVIHFLIGGVVLLMSACGCIGAFAMLAQGIPGILGAVRTLLGLLAGPVLVAQGVFLLQAKNHIDTIGKGAPDDPTELAGVFGRVKIFFAIEVAYGLVQLLMGCVDIVTPVVTGGYVG